MSLSHQANIIVQLFMYRYYFYMSNFGLYKAFDEAGISNMVECKSRGAYLMGLTIVGNYNIEESADFTVYIPETDEHFATSLAVIPLQLMGYYVSVAKGLDVDKPRNLANNCYCVIT